MKKLAVVLLNLGGPDSPEAVRPFLFNLFRDKSILRVPALIRWPLAAFIAKKRAPVAAKIYALIGGRSPLVPNTEIQARALEIALGDAQTQARCFIAMRYWHPFSIEAAQQVQEWGADEIVLLPLYPQWSTTTTSSSLRVWNEACATIGLKTPARIVCCYPTEAGFIQAEVAKIRTALNAARSYGPPRLLFSAHGLPERIVKSGDPYQWQCEQTAKAIVAALDMPGLDWVNCYQSRVGRMKWIGPSTDDELHRAGADKVPVVVAPIAFVSEHSETLVEIEIEYRHLAEEVGVPYFARVDTVGADAAFIGGLASLVRGARVASTQVTSERGGRICPPNFAGCCQR
ncbi:ferrochelatase [Roseiterribacter gracilis]|uniref:Ferrochelatase n=1 Tax=Roseiterribacter gracilis TaxID=2812848 RepID=A0A8S8X9Q1_9PROT|nr:ferrochelatase [Rhodospirillales bacterium TMPK1]